MVAAIHKIVDYLDRLNYRIVYISLALLLALPYIVGNWESKPRPRAITRGMFDAIEQCAEEGKPVLLLNSWIMDSRGENQPQFEAVVEHMMRRRVKFIMLSTFVDTSLVGADLCKKSEQYFKQEFGEDYIEYGRDWLMLGYRILPGGWPIWVPNMKEKGIVGTFRTDYQGVDLWKYPIMERPEGAVRGKPSGQPTAPQETGQSTTSNDESSGAVEIPNGGSAGRAPSNAETDTAHVETETGTQEVNTDDYLQLGDFGLVLEIHFTSGASQEIIGLVRLDKELEGPEGKPQIRVALGTVNMVVNQMLPFFDSGDLSGILAGVQGAAEYSELLKDKYGDGPSRAGVAARANPYSMGVLFVLFVIVLGNLCTLWRKLSDRGQAGVNEQ
ncbi:MAG: hypothetical protein JW889_07860 [Verrucomicrobia bacterium]|nr:hypothetical protein [Verrucomicrobiota bacterium]